jgi:hypothetical protein
LNLPFVFANPWGALALLGVPAVIAIHCLQQKSRALSISTLFLLDRLAPDSRQGRRITWLRNSLAFWLQLLCVLVVTWLLLEPRWLEANYVQRVVLVLDSSISMRAFSDQIVARTSPRLTALSALAPRTYWTVRETDPTAPTLYEGFDLAALDKKLQAWAPSLPAHDPTHALELARALAPRDALAIFVTDRPHEVPSGVELLAVGEPIENCGLVGCRISPKGDDLEWQVMAQNYGKKTQPRSWWIEIAGQKSEAQAIDLEPGHPQVLKGIFPRGTDRLEVCLQPDQFSLDDRMAIVRPQPKEMTVELLGDDSTIDLFTRLAQTIPSLATVQAGERADLDFRALNPTATFPGSAVSSVVVFNAPDDKDAFTGGPYAMEEDPLNQDLNWQALVAQPLEPFPHKADDHVLLWKGQKPVIYIRTGDGNLRQLIFNFNFSTSNAARLPAFVLLVSRFVESLRQDKVAPETRNVELAESLALTTNPQKGALVLHGPNGDETRIEPQAIANLHAPTLPGFFTVTQGDATLLTAAAQFADARESDFSTATTADTLASHGPRLVELRTRADAWGPLWLLVLGAALVLSWVAAHRRTV